MKDLDDYLTGETGLAYEFNPDLEVIPVVDAIRIMKEYAEDLVKETILVNARNKN